MNNSELHEAGPPSTFDNTMLASYLQCPRNLYFFLLGIRPVLTPPYFTFGRAWGQALNTWHSLEGKMTNEERLFLAQETASKIWASENPEEKGVNTFSILQSLLNLYAQTYPGPELWKTLATEVGFEFPIPGTSFNYGGSLDSYISWEGYGLLFREDKTTGEYLSSTYIAQWSHSSQVTGYTWALNQILEEPCLGGLLNIASKRMRKDKELMFTRNIETRSEWKVQKFMQETIGIADMIRREWDHWTWPKWGERHPNTCSGGMGKSPCPYRNLCILDNDPWEVELNLGIHGLREVGPWKPWEREGDDQSQDAEEDDLC